ncbi:BON domain-containing protein [Pragia fontium]|uniref:BON domain-containing protein n=1 Tax=Pragia fontium TaxID=82985 RepID=A0ABQ5LJ73_9GAMM|nr:BON domain-containing protein [Pragia fontium]GKX63624.1 hypothetical protein SOASR032_21930 [Pragia fontium]VEJ52811.1 Osmotically-inducible protein Y precursor [Pragia fontium]
MKSTTLSKAMMVAVLGSVLVGGSVFAQETIMDKAKATADEAGTKIDSSMKKVDNYMDDSGITAKIKTKLLEAKDIKSTGVSVKTTDGVVYLTGHVASQAESEHIVKVVGAVEGVKSVKNDLVVKP